MVQVSEECDRLDLENNFLGDDDIQLLFAQQLASVEDREPLFTLERDSS
ncbi:MAG TPA: hypothetical protein VKE51_11785 [Vicinamibacterales bacterium]|nr:hypothetical protein [Vicinamibacterales bacterium]